MTCDRYRPQLALLVGNDLDSREAVDVRQHLSGCPSCRAHFDALELSMNSLQAVSQKTVTPEFRSLWPALSQRLQKRAVLANEPAPGWMTLGAFAAACAAVLWLTVSTPVFDFELTDAQVADFTHQQLSSPRPAASQFPQLQFVNAAQPVIPFDITGGLVDESFGELPNPERILGGPRSF